MENYSAGRPPIHCGRHPLRELRENADKDVTAPAVQQRRIHFVCEHRPVINHIAAIAALMTAFSACAVESMAFDGKINRTDAVRFDSVRKLLETRCLSCHNDHDHKGDFSLQSAPALLESGFVVPGDANDSHLLSVVIGNDGQKPSMPKNADPLSDDEVRILKAWIVNGADWPDGVTLKEPVVDDFAWWSFLPLTAPGVPAPGSENPLWNHSPIDLFVAAKQREQGLTRSSRADRRTLIRRVTYDLTGLPPTPEEVRAFEDSNDPEAYRKLVDQLLDSPRYGERWARHWLDVVKYADTCGYDKDKLRPNAWPYRDYVIKSFNDDKPYTRFVHEQIAGDVLFPGEADGILGLGFIAAGPWDFIGHVEVPESKIDGRVARNLDRDEMVTNTLNTFCSVTIQCARCHNHKFDPFTQEHYYSFQAIFAAVDRAERIYDTDPNVEEQRRQLMTVRDQAAAELKRFDEDVETQGGDDLKRVRARVANLREAAKPVDKRPEYGYHSAMSATADNEKWVEVDLGREVQVARIVIHPCHDEFNNINAGFGFPVRFRVDVRTRPDAETASVLPGSDRTAADFPNPGISPVEFSGDPFTARFIRVTATKLMPRSGDYNFALSEIEVFNEAGMNIAAGAAVRAKDSIEAPVRWRKSNLTDGIWPRGGDPEAARQLAEALRHQNEILDRILTPERVAHRATLAERRADADKKLGSLPKGRVVYAGATHFSPQGNFKPTMGVPRAVKVLHRGNIQQPTTDAAPGVIPLSRGAKWKLDLPAGHTEGDRRAALARWITAPDNPLTWRSIANRIWQYHFGTGIFESPNDMGRMGQSPTHPFLLDWLANEFRRTQSFKHMHRLIVNSETYKQASDFDPANAAIDSSNRYLWRMNRRRLSAEELRDSILAVSGKLNLQMGGPGYYLFALEKTAHSPHYEYHKFDPNDEKSHRRSIYRFIVRSQPDPYMTTLDCADSSQSTPRRTETLTSLQALSLLNNKFNLVMAQHFAARIETSDQPTHTAFQLLTGRHPTDAESATLNAYAAEHGLANLCRILFNTSEFVFVD